MNDILSLWRAPLDDVAVVLAEGLLEHQPQCSIMYNTEFNAMTVYNFGYYAGTPGGGSPSDNTGYLTQMFTDMSTASGGSGGTAFIPQNQFQVDAALPPALAVPDQCNIIGSGEGGTAETSGASPFYHFIISDPPDSVGPFAFFYCAGDHTTGGKYFRGLAFQWSSPSTGDICIVAGTWNCRAINCTFTDCPTAFDTRDTVNTKNGESGVLEQCTIQYTIATPSDTTAVVLSGPQCGVIGPGEFSQTSPGSEGASGCTCIAINGPAQHAVIADMRIYEWTYGVSFSQKDGSEYTHITNCDIACWQTALNIQLYDASETTAGIKVTSCTLAKASDSTDGHPIVLIDALASSHNNKLNDIALIDCSVFNTSPSPPANQHGLQIMSGSNIRIIGGTYSNNSPNGGAGIAITGACSDVQIIGVNLQPSYAGSPNTYNQEYALLVSAVPTTVLVSGCDMNGYSTRPGGPVNVTGTQSSLLIYDCPGYNDRNTALNAGVAPTSSTNAATCSTPYFGPSVFTFSNTAPVTLHIFGQTIMMTFGVIFLPSPYDSFYFSPSPTLHFSWVGK